MDNLHMTKRWKIGVSAPPKDHTGFHGYQGIFPPAIRGEFIEKLGRHPNIELIELPDLSHACIKNGRVYSDDVCISDLDLFFWFHILPLGKHMYDIILLKTLAAHTRVIPNPSGVEHGLDKFVSQTILKRHHIATPEFCLFRSDKVSLMTGLLDSWQELVLKPRLGSFGHGITRISSKQQFLDVVQYAASFSNDPISIFCERFEPNDITRWISATVIDGKIAYGYRKRPSRFVDGWKVYDPDNIGGESDYADASPVADIALAAYSALGADLIGFDFIYSDRLQQYLIVDANTVPGLYEDCFAHAGTKTWADYFADMVIAHLT